IVSGELARVIGVVRPLAVAPPVLIAPPMRPGDPWTAASDAANRPLRSTVKIDGRTGTVISREGFAQRHWIDQTIGYGVAGHEGALFGLANQLLGTVTALLLVVLAGSGVVMWWRRRHVGLGAPIALSRPRLGAGVERRREGV
ncbi:PepSY domain-containing protein, partial [Pseudomonas proteolytica]|uniref:PepSY domain-containing protein n=1 Tax=Pseudomonas proteolytica TaxID=219574 RepID=UPI0030DBC80C